MMNKKFKVEYTYNVETKKTRVEKNLKKVFQMMNKVVYIEHNI